MQRLELYHKSGRPSSPASALRGVPSPVLPGGVPLVSSGQSVSLGSITKLLNPPSDQEGLKLLRWALQAAARDVLSSVSVNEKSLRVCSCCRKMVNSKAGVDIWKHRTNFNYKGLAVCGSVWLCPICVVKISEKRRDELKRAMVKNTALGGSQQLWTFTAPHDRSQSLQLLLDAMNKARGVMLNRRTWKRLIASVGVRGTVRALEVTFSWENGWHVHFHVLAFMLKRLSSYDLKAIEDEMHNLWLAACTSVGLAAPSRAHGVTVQGGDVAGDYVGKWGTEHELTKWHSKKGKAGHLTPFDFLRRRLDGDNQYDHCFREYARAFEGKQQLLWSRGLKGSFGIDEVSDDVIADTLPEKSAFFANLPAKVWSVILRRERRGEVLAICRNGRQALITYIFCLTGVVFSDDAHVQFIEKISSRGLVAPSSL